MHSASGSALGGQGVIGRMVGVQENQLVLATWQQMSCGRKEREGGGQGGEDQSWELRYARSHAGCFLTAHHLMDGLINICDKAFHPHFTDEETENQRGQCLTQMKF